MKKIEKPKRGEGDQGKTKDQKKIQEKTKLEAISDLKTKDATNVERLQEFFQSKTSKMPNQTENYWRY